VNNVFWLYSVLVRDASLRDALTTALAETGIETRPFFHPIHTFPMYRHCRTDNGCPVACDLSGRGLNLPTSSYLKQEDVHVIAEAFRARLAAVDTRKGAAVRAIPKSRAA
jgi:perosamine synthetase